VVARLRHRAGRLASRAGARGWVRERLDQSPARFSLIKCLETRLAQTLNSLATPHEILCLRNNTHPGVVTTSAGRAARESPCCALAPASLVASLIDAAYHNITPAVDKQLVLELKLGIGLSESLDWFLSIFRFRKACPLTRTCHTPRRSWEWSTRSGISSRRPCRSGGSAGGTARGARA